MIRRRVVIHGHVQGVFFRDTVRRNAVSAGVSGGWVRNTREGTVEAVFEGAESVVEELVAFCHVGPRGARVERVEVSDEPVEGIGGFAIR